MTMMNSNSSSNAYFKFLLLSLSIWALPSVSALPYPGVTSHSQNMTYNENSGRMSYRDVSDDMNYYRRESTKCSSLSVDQAKKMPGWAKLEQYAKDTWGDGGWNIVTNPPEYTDRWADSCVDDAPVKIEPIGKPTCNTRSVGLDSTSDGTQGTNSVKVTTGQSTSGSWTITRESEFGVDATVEVGFSIPDIFEASASVTTSTHFKNSRSDTFTTTTSSMTESTVVRDAIDGQECSVELEVKSCEQKGNGKIRVVGRGFVWFNYEDKRAPKNGDPKDKHFKYAAKIEDVLSLDERTSWMEFEGSVSGESKGKATSSCKKPGQKKVVKKPIEKKPGEKKPDEKKPAEKKPTEKKPAEKKPGDKNPPPKPAPAKPTKKSEPKPKKPAPKPTEKKPPAPKNPAKRPTKKQ